MDGVDNLQRERQGLAVMLNSGWLRGGSGCCGSNDQHAAVRELSCGLRAPAGDLAIEFHSGCGMIAMRHEVFRCLRLYQLDRLGEHVENEHI